METYNYQQPFTVGGTIDRAWALTMKHFPVFLLLTILGFIVSSIVQLIYYVPYIEMLATYGSGITEEEWLATMFADDDVWSWFSWLIVAVIFTFFANNYLVVVGCRMLNAAVRGNKVDMTLELKDARHTFWFYLGAYIVYSVIVMAGTIFCVIPGIFLGVRLMFVPMIASNHPEIPFSEAFSRSWKMTEGHFWRLFGLGIVMILLNIVGLIFCCIGYLLTIVITSLAYACAYNSLSPIESEPVVEEVVIEQQ
ncbi:MAG: hypothetical protein E7099_03640 [Mediterranea massiliensis]|nr:hypothetical protein [Mediterranea massiliensis]